MEKKISVRKIISSIVHILVLIPFLACTSFVVCVCSDSESIAGRRSGYTESEVLEILMAEYKRDFIILSSYEDDVEVRYTVCPKDYPGIVFTFRDYNDGIAGWFAEDNFGDSVLLYCAELYGFSTASVLHSYDNPTIYCGGKAIDTIAVDLKNTFDLYFEIFNYCKGDITRYSSYNPCHKGKRTEFILTWTTSDNGNCFADCVIHSAKYTNKLYNSIEFTDQSSKSSIMMTILHYCS